MKKIAIDMVTISPGKGGAGGGIYTYAKNLLIYLDKICDQPQDYKIYCLVNNDFDLTFANIEVVKFGLDARGYLNRMLYIHILLPLFCLRHGITVLHKLASEIPFFSTPAIVVTVHDFLLEHYMDNRVDLKSSLMGRLKNWYFFSITKYALRHAKYVVTPSSTIKNEAIRRYNISTDKLFVAELAAQNFADIKVRGSGDSFNIFYIAAFHPHKGHLKAIEVFEILREKYNVRANLFFRGNVSSKAVYDSVVERARNSTSASDIHMVGYDKNSSLKDIYASADCIWLFSDYEGFGLPLLEAQIHGVPVICTDIEIFREVLEDSAIIIKGDNGTIAAAIAGFLTDPVAQHTITEAGLRNAARYSWERFAFKVAEVYKKALQ